MPENGDTYRMQLQAQPGSQLRPEERPSQNTPRTVDAELPTRMDEGNQTRHSSQQPPKNESLVKNATNRPQEDLEHKIVEGQLAPELGKVMDEPCSQSQPGRHLLSPKVTMNPSGTLATEKKPDGRDLHLLSIDGRGICGLSALIILKEVLRQYQYSQKLPQLPRPCDVFDLAGGAGTGGIIAIMLFRLEMTVDEAIMAYTNLSADVFSKTTVLRSQKTKASRLENAIANLIRSSLDGDETQGQMIRMLDEEGPKCFVTASHAKSMSSPTLFRTYMPPRLPSYNCTIVEASRATTAEEPFFPSIDIGDAKMKETFIYGGSRINSPVKAVLLEAKSIFPDQSVCCMLSIGSGAQGVIGLEGTPTTKHTRVLKKLMNDGEQISDEVAKELWGKEVFTCWLNVDHGLEGIGFDDWEKLGEVRTHTQKYLEKFDVTQKVFRLVQILNQRTATASTVQRTLTDLGQFLDSFISVLPNERWGTVISAFIRIVKPSKAATERLNVQCALLRDTLESCLQGKDVMELPDEVKENIRKLLEGLKTTFHDSPGQDNPMAYLNTNIQTLLQHFWVKNHIAGNIIVHDILKYIQKDDSMKKTFTRLEQHAMNQNLGNLNASPFASYDSSEVSEKPSCFKGTRVRFLNEIANWMTGDDPNLAPIYVLDGVAGIGKSTIAKTVAEHAAGINTLGASFFFSRNDDKRKTTKTFFSTIAYQLAYYDKAFADGINEALLRAPHVVTQMPIKQFSTLIIEPLEEALAMAGNPILIVIDALDECEHDGDVLLKIFADSITKLPRLKLFITTRPEYHIRTVLDRYHHLKRFHLQDVEQSVVQSDLRLFLDFHLSENQVRDKLPDLRCTWKPTKEDMGMLIGICGTLFIIASTAVRFILDNKRSDPAKQLSRLLRGVSRRDFSGSKHTTVLDSFYTQILLAAVPDDDDDDDDEDDAWFEHYQLAVGTIVVLQYPLPCVSLSALLNADSDDVIRALCHLHSLLAPTDHDLTFRIHHKSFPDFVTSPSRCERRFLIDSTTRHLELGKRCLKVLLGSTDCFRDNNDVQHLTKDCIAQELAYASTHWATHLDIASKLDGEAVRLLEDFARLHFLAWLEVLSIIGQVETAYASLDKIGKLLDGCKTTAGIAREILHDGCRFIALNLELVKAAADHILSAFAFVPQDTRLFRTYRGMKGSNLAVVSGYARKWNPIISVMTGHEKAVNSVTFSGDGTRLASTSKDKTVRLWDSQTGGEIAVLRGHSGAVRSVVFSPDSTTLASASDDTTVRLWDGQTGTEVAVLRGHSGEVSSVVFSLDGTRLASASNDGTARLWDGQTSCEIAVLRGYLDTVNSIEFSTDAIYDWAMRMWDNINSVMFSPDGTRLASASDDGTVRLWDGQTGGEIAILQGHSDTVNAVVFSPDGTRLASASDDGTVRLWGGEKGDEIAVLRGHSKLVKLVVFSPGGTKLTLASASADKTVRLWDGRAGKEIAILRGHSGWVNSIAISSDGTKLVSASNEVRLWDGQTGAEIAVFQNQFSSINSVVFSPDGTKFASASNDVRLWDGQTSGDTAVLQGHLDAVNSLVFSPDGTKLAAGYHDETVRLWGGKNGAEIAVLRGHSKAVTSVVFSPDGTRLASASYYDGVVQLWDCQTGTEIVALEGDFGGVNSVVFSPDGTRLASAHNAWTVRLWDGQTGTAIAALRGHVDSVKSVAFSSDGTNLASGSADRTMRMWDGQTGAEITVFRGHLHSINSVAFSSDGTKLASAEAFGSMVRLWDCQTGTEIASFLEFTFIGFTLDSSKLLLMNTEEVYQVDCLTGDKLAVPLGIFMEPRAKGVQVPGSNVWVIRVDRQRPSLSGLLVIKVDDKGDLRFRSLCWFSPDLPVTSLAISIASRVAVGCQNGRLLLLGTDISSLL